MTKYFPHFFEDLTCNIRIVHRTHRRAKGFDSFLTNNVKACRCRAKNVNEENKRYVGTRDRNWRSGNNDW